MRTQLLKNILGAFLLLLFFAFTTAAFAGTSAIAPSFASAAQYHHYRHHHYYHHRYYHHHYYHHHPAVHVVIHN